MTIAEKIAEDVFALNIEAGFDCLKRNDLMQLIATVAERGIEEACKVIHKEVDFDMMVMGLCGDIRVNRWWEEEA